MTSEQIETPRVAAGSPGRYLLTIRRKDLPLPFVRMTVAEALGATSSVFLPATDRIRYVLMVDTSDVELVFSEAEVSEVSLRPIGPLAYRYFLRRRKDLRQHVDAGMGVRLIPYLRGEGAAGKEMRKALRFLSNWGFGLNSANLQKTPGLLSQNSRKPVLRRRTAPSGPPRFALVLHLYYRELWPEFESYMSDIDIPFRLIVSTTEQDDAFARQVRASFPEAEIHVLENRGRDVGPFFELLRKGVLDDYPYVCKLHGKQSGTSGPRALLGTLWRRTNIVDLIGSSQQVGSILDMFDKDPQIGMIGSSRFRLPNKHISLEPAWAKNRDKTRELTKELGMTIEETDLDFFAGTMFWIRREALIPLRRLDIKIESFEEERGMADGELAHALERIFGFAVAKVGMRLENAPSTLEETPAAGPHAETTNKTEKRGCP